MNVRKTGRWQRTLALMLCVAMLASIVPAGASAAQADGGAYAEYVESEVISEPGRVHSDIAVQAVGWNDNDGRDGFVGPNISEANKDNNVKTETVAASDIDFNLYNYSYKINTDGAGNRRQAALTGAYFFSPGGHNLFPDAEAARDLANTDFYDHPLYGFSTASNTGWELFQENNMARNLYYDQYTGEYYPMLGSNRTNRNNGQAVLNEDQAKLGYLYGGTDYVAGDGTQKADASLVTAYEDIPQTPLRLTEDGYYVYNSALNAADYLVDENNLIVRGYKERTEQSANVAHLFENHTSAVADFLPFNSVHDTVDQYALHSNGNGYRFYYKDQIGETGASGVDADTLPFADYWFGATMDFDFVQAPGGVWNGKEVVYEFSGDDDVMVYLDGKLVLDMSGNHKRVSGTINFNTGLVEAYQNSQEPFGRNTGPIAVGTQNVSDIAYQTGKNRSGKLNNALWEINAQKGWVVGDARITAITQLATTGYTLTQSPYTGQVQAFNMTELRPMYFDINKADFTALDHKSLINKITAKGSNLIKYDADGIKSSVTAPQAANNGEVSSTAKTNLFTDTGTKSGYPYFENKHPWYWYKYNSSGNVNWPDGEHIKIEYNSTTIYESYKLALREAGLTETEAKAELDKIFEPTGGTVTDALGRSYPVYRFRDYSKHSFNWFYQERFAGASNFSVKFNLPTIPANSLVIGKELDYVNEDGTSAASSPALEQTLTYSFRVLETDEAGTVAADIGTDGLLVTPGTQYKIYEDFTNTGEVGIVDEDGCIHLKPGQQAVIDQLIETYGNDTYYVVEELIPEEFSAQYGDVIMSGGEKDTVEIRDENGALLYRGYRTGVQNTGAEKERMVNIFTNQIKVTKLSSFELTKVLDPEAEQLLKGETFTFEVLLGGTRLAPGTGYTVGTEPRKTDANGYITLKQNETARLEGIISGTEFQVREVYKAFSDYEAVFTGHTVDENNRNQELEASVDVISGRIPLHGSVRVTATNQIRPGTLETDKYVEATEDANEFVLTLEAYAWGRLEETTQSGTAAELDETAILKEVLTDYFVLDPDTEVDVRMYTTAYNGDGTFAAPVEKTETDGFRYVLSSGEDTDRMDTIEVTGFDYQDAYISNVSRTVNGKNYYGSKLIVKVHIRTRDGFWGGNNVPTNEETTGIYDRNGVPVADFPEPEVNVPLDVEVTTKNKTIYYGGDVTAMDLLERVTAGGMDVTVNDDGTFTPAEDWMDDYADLSWTTDSTKPGDTPDNMTPDDYTFELQLKPRYDGTRNRQDEPGNIAGNVNGGEIKPGDLVASADTDASIGHVYILVPELIFRDSVTDFGTPVEGYDFEGRAFVGEKIIWIDMELGRKPGDGIPALDQYAVEPTVKREYIPENGAAQFTGDTKVDVTVSINGKDITDLVYFRWQNCELGEHGSCGTINAHAGRDDVHEFWIHITIRIQPDTVVIDYGLSVLIDPLTNDLHGYSVVTEKVLNGIGDAFGTSHTGTFGAAAVEGSEVRYTPNTSNGMQMDREETFRYQGTYTIKGREYTADSTITVIPATSIYYEDSFLDYKVYDYNTDQELTDKSWETVAGENAVQDTDRPGTDQIGRDLDNPYGYDSQYTDEGGYSLESCHKITVDENTYGKATFTFTGTAFDVIALSGNTTGTITVSVYNGTGPLDRPNRVCNYMVDTYYGYTYKDGQWVITDANDPNALYQVPVMKVDMADHVKENNGYGTYTAVITVSYNDMFDHEQYGSNGGKYDFMLDAIRIYDQANDGEGSKVIEDAYKADGEGWPTYTELRNILIDANTFDSLGEDDVATGIVFIDGIYNPDDDSASGSADLEEDMTPTIRDYANFGPNNELYLASGQGVAFYLDIPENVRNVHLALKSVGGTAGVKVYGVNADGTRTYALGTESAAMDIATATDLYYDITGLKNKTVVIASSGDAILSITNIKMTYSSKPAAPAGQTEQEMAMERFQVSREIAELALNALIPAPVNPFADVFEGDYYYESILWAVRKGITNGVDESHFDPAGNCNRAQVVTFLWRAAGCPEPNASKHPFVDVEANSFYYKAMLWAVEKGITNGTDATHFDPTGVCNRAQVVTFLWRVAGCPEAVRTEHPFEDVEAGSFYHEATLWAVEKGITNGMTATSFAPALTCTRGQVVTFLYRAYTR